MPIKPFTIILVLTISLMGLGTAMSDEIRLKNGDRLSGQVVTMEGGKLVFKTSYAGNITINWTDVVVLVTDSSLNVVLSDDTSLRGTSTPAEEGNMILETKTIEGAVSVHLAEVKAINIQPPPAVKLTARVNVGINVTKGNTENQTYHLDGEAVARTVKSRYTVGGQFNRESAENKQTANNALGYMRYDYFLTKKWYLNTNASFEHDKFQDLNLRTTVGAGLGYQFLESDLTNLSLAAGPAYVNEDYQDEKDNSYAAGQWSLNFDRYLFEKFIQFFHNHSGFVGLEDLNNTFIRSQTGLRIPFYKQFNLTGQYNLDWNNSPAPGRKSVDQQYILSLGYQY
jgi:putative salt-induced outer membrane protein YdiY